MNYKRKGCLLFLIISLCLLSLSALLLIKNVSVANAASGKFSGGEGNESSPYLISNAADFEVFMDEVNNRTAVDGYFNTYFELTNDIDLSEVSINPIGTQLYPFKGHLDGKGYNFNNISILNPNGDYVGLFGAISKEASILNLSIKGSVCGLTNVGGIVGLNQGRIENCENRCTVLSAQDATAMNIGGICGHNIGTIINSYNFVRVSGSGANVGGIAGINAVDGKIEKCFNTGNVESKYYSVGGIAGNNDAEISECFNNASVKGYSTIGGISGSCTATGIIENCYNTSVITASYNMAGGISGTSEGAIYNSYNCADIVAGSYAGAICGYVANTDTTIIDSCFFSSDRFDGKMTQRNNNYPNSKVLRDVDLANGDTLTNAEKAKALASGRGDGVWTYRTFDDNYSHYPELSVLKSNENEVVAQRSESSVQVARATVEVELEKTEFVYNGKSCEPEVYKVDEKLLRNVDYTVEFENNLNSGLKDSASAKITFINYYKGSTTKYFTIFKSELIAEWTTDKITYNGQVQHPNLIIKSGAAEGDNITFHYDCPSNINIGTYTVTAELDKDNSVNSNYTFTAMTTKYSIDCAKLTLEWDTQPLYYNGAAQHPNMKNVIGIQGEDNVELIYSGYEKNINAANGYKVKVVSADKNYSLNEEYVYSIQKQPLTIEFDETDLFYNGKSQYPKIASITGVVNGENVKFKYSGYENNISANSSYDVDVALADTKINSNYSFNSIKKNYEIKKKIIDVIFSTDNPKYNSEAQYPTYTVTGVVENEELEFQLSDYSNNIVATDGAIYEVSISLSDKAVNNNYSFETIKKTYGIDKAEITIKWDETVSLIYNAQAQHPQAIITSEVYDTINLIYGVCNNVNAGDGYTVEINSDNVNYVVNNNLSYSIKQKQLIVKWDDNTLVYNGQEQYPLAEVSGAINGENVTFFYSGYDGNFDVGINYSVQINLEENSTNSNYCFDEDQSVKVYSICAKEVEVIGLVAIDRHYNGDVKVEVTEGTITGLLNEDEISFKVLEATMLDANTGKNKAVNVILEAVGDKGYRYKLFSQQLSVDIFKSVFDSSKLIFNQQTFCFDGKPKSIFIESELPPDVTITYEGNEKTNVGKYKVIANFVYDENNYEPISAITSEFFISPNEYTCGQVTLKVVSGYIEYGATLSVENKDFNGYSFGNNEKLLQSFEIKLIKEGNEIQPNGTVQIIISLEDIQDNGLKLYCTENDSIKDTPFQVNNGKLQFSTEKLTDFCIVKDLSNTILWACLGPILGVLVIAAIVVVSIIMVKRKKCLAVQSTNNAVDSTDLKTGDN